MGVVVVDLKFIFETRKAKTVISVEIVASLRLQSLDNR